MNLAEAMMICGLEGRDEFAADELLQLIKVSGRKPHDGEMKYEDIGELVGCCRNTVSAIARCALNKISDGIPELSSELES